VKELMKFVNAEVTPFIIFAKEFVVVEIKFELIIVEVPTDPATFDVKVFTDEVSVFGTCKFVTAKLVKVALFANKLFVLVVDAFTEPKIGLFEKE
jgi:hypothetical protein